MLQVCKRQSNKPYYVQAIDQNVYSLEEINYFLYNHMNLVYRDFFSEDLYDYMETELDAGDMAEELRRMDAQEASVRDFIMYVLKESRYYSADDLSAVSGLIMNINNLSRDERMLIEADSMMKQKRFGTALHIYLDILGERDEEDGLKDRFYAKVAFSIGIVYAKMFMCRNANAYFNMAYDIYADPVYAKASVYMSMISGNDEELLSSIIKYKVSDEALEVIRRNIEKARDSIMAGREYSDLCRMQEEDDGLEKQIAKWKNEYYTMLS